MGVWCRIDDEVLREEGGREGCEWVLINSGI